MENQCNKCIFYSKSYDKMNKDYNENEKEKHFCPALINKIIPQEVWEDKKQCKFKIAL